MPCASKPADHQPFPQTGQLARHFNLHRETLRQHIPAGPATVYGYVIATIKNCQGTFVQTGCAPNLQGDRVTLCTCKHYMRTFLDVQAWPGKWIAGFTGSPAGQGRNYLVYLMQVQQAYASQYDFWFSETVPERTKRAKATHRHRFGDVYQPRSELIDPFDPQGYVPPRSDHVHAPEEWRQDIDYVSRTGRPAALLVGDPQHTYLWDRPLLFSAFKLYRGQKKLALADLLARLQEGEAL
jgi:hypothetical protein